MSYELKCERYSSTGTDRMKICHVNFARGFRGGERQTEVLIRELSGLGVSQRLVVRHESPLRLRLRGLSGTEVIGLRAPVMLQPWATHGFALVHAHEAMAAHYAHLAYRLGGPRYLITRRMTKRPGGNRATRAVYRNAKRVIAISSAIERVVREYSPSTPVVRIPSMASHLPVDPAAVEAIRRRFGGSYLVLQVGALIGNKGQRVLLDALRSLGIPNVRVAFLGEGPDRAALEALAADIPGITFTGFVDDVANWIAASDLVVHPSLEEGLGSTLLDVMERGRPIIASRTGGIPDIIVDEDNGLLVPPGDPEALAAAIRRLHDDRALAGRFAEGGRRRLPPYLPAIVARRTLEEYHACSENEAVRVTS